MDLAPAILAYLVTAVLVLGLAWRIAKFMRAPVGLPIAVTPAPRTSAGVAWRLTKEVLVFASLFQSNKWTWFFGWIFHAALALVLLRHLRYFLEPVPTWVLWLQPWGRYAGFAMVFGLLGLWARRLLVARVRFISTPSDHLMLLLLGLIGFSGLMMSFVIHTDLIALKRFTLGLFTFEWSALPGGPLLVHLLAVGVLLMIVPVSKLLHVPGVFLSPSRARADTGRRPVARREGA
ncbi:MAG: respiratory nitrate reductase subunit gamma [Betaproteobacteria bacterium]|nr:respiratory nitrate reductase subunit gamma [Betaproteobacteria bacterium]